MEQTLQNLTAHSIPLYGKHLIEASAGTGKTFNITRIYLRLLLERELTVEQILVMTFTKDATEELRGRIDSFIREALNQWSTLIEIDPYFRALSERIPAEKAQFLLKRALLFLDEASIFTIHGFCKRVLSQHAFTSGLPFNAQMEADTKTITLEACQDWYRNTAQHQPDTLITIAHFWPDPLSFINHFTKAINHHADIAVLTAEYFAEKFQILAKAALFSLNQADDLLNTALIDVKKGNDKAQRIQELTALKQWLTDISADDFSLNSLAEPAFAMPDAFIDGRRFSRSKVKAELIEAFIDVNKVKAQAKQIPEKLLKAKAFAIVRDAIYQIRHDIEVKKQQLSVLNFDDLIKTLALCLSNTENTLFAEKLFQQFPVALVDEFQDTDPQQYAILQAIYHQAACDKVAAQQQGKEQGALYLIGDPKQAIYGFRGGDVFAYLAARKDCEYQWLMDTNWRSSKAMIDGYNQLFVGEHLTNAEHVTNTEHVANPSATAVFGYDIPYIPVKASPVANKIQPIDHHFNALQFIHFTRENTDKAQPQSFRANMAHWCASEISRLLQATFSTAETTPKITSEIIAENLTDVATTNKTVTVVVPQDIAILVRDGTEANEIKQALEAKGLASVFLSNRSNLFHSQQMQQLRLLLTGVLYAENERAFIAALSCGLLGFTPIKLYQLQSNELAYQSLKFTFMALRTEWQKRGFISMALKLMHEHFNLPVEDKDRSLTNLLHLFELLQSASQRYKQPQELLYWFEQQSQLENPDAEAEIRLESDDDLIRIVTQHGAKGLEYPVVFVPFATRYKDPLMIGTRAVNYIEYHDEQGKLQLSLDATAEAKQAMANEAYAESIRLLYVAITRAEQRCYVLTTDFNKAYLSPLGQTLKWQNEVDILASLQALANLSPEAIAVHCIQPMDDTDFDTFYARTEHHNSDRNNSTFDRLNDKALAEHIHHKNTAVNVATFTGHIERDWWLSSFSALSRNIRHGGVSLPDRDNELMLNEENHAAQNISSESSTIVEPLLRFELVKGAHSGNLLHNILECCDFSAPNWLQICQTPLRSYGLLPTGFTEQNLHSWLEEVIAAPLPKGGSLADIVLNQSLRESEFYYPMKKASSGTLANLLTDHRNRAPVDDNNAMQRNLQRNKAFRLPHYQKLSGMMHGFIDLIFQHQGKYYVSDYKSNYLGEQLSDYHHDALLIDIEKHHYDLQYLIYSLALHRKLKQVLSDYDFELHFGGVYYFYLRGMTDDAAYADKHYGIYYRKITADEIEQLDNLFSGSTDTLGDIK